MVTSSLSQISVQFQIQPLTWVNPSWALNLFPLGNHCTGPDVPAASQHWWPQGCNLSEQNKCELPASHKNWPALGAASLLLCCFVGWNSCTLRVISAHFWRLLCKTSFSYWTQLWQQKGLTRQKAETAGSGTQMPLGVINPAHVELLKGCCAEHCPVCSCTSGRAEPSHGVLCRDPELLAELRFLPYSRIIQVWGCLHITRSIHAFTCQEWLELKTDKHNFEN